MFSVRNITLTEDGINEACRIAFTFSFTLATVELFYTVQYDYFSLEFTITHSFGAWSKNKSAE